MLFITNRFPKESIKSESNRKFTFDLDNNGPSNSVFFCRRNEDGSITEVGAHNLMAELKKSEYRQILLYIHGFANMPDDVFDAVNEFQGLCDKAKKGEVLAIPMIWPCDNGMGIVGNYWDDQKSADASKLSFSRVLEMFDDWRNNNEHNPIDTPCLKRINILAHSMGNRVLRETLCAWDDYDLANGVPLIFKNTFLVAADIVNESLHRGQRGEVITHSSRNVVCYFASDDLALRASKAANLKNKIASRRLGHTGPEDMSKTPGNVSAVDCDDVNTLYDLPKGHSYFRSGRDKGTPGVVFDHIFQSILTGRPEIDNDQLRLSILND